MGNTQKILKYFVQTLLLGTFIYLTVKSVQKLQKKEIGLTTTSTEPLLINLPSATICYVPKKMGYVPLGNDTFSSAYEILNSKSYKVTLERFYSNMYEKIE